MANVLVVDDMVTMRRIVELAQIGVNGYIIKPFTPDTLVKVVSKILEK